MNAWTINPQTGGTKIPPHVQERIVAQVEAYAAKQPWSSRFKLILRFKHQFCYLDASEEGETPFPIGRLRYFDEDRFSLAFYTYSNERYQPCIFNNGRWFGSVENAIDICAIYLV